MICEVVPACQAEHFQLDSRASEVSEIHRLTVVLVNLQEVGQDTFKAVKGIKVGTLQTPLSTQQLEETSILYCVMYSHM